MINEIDILQNRECRNFGGYPSEKSEWLFCIVSYHQEFVVELREKSFDSFMESFVVSHCLTPVFLIAPIGYLKM